MTQRELAEQLDLIERMIREGQRTMERYGWAFVVWGVGHVAAILWSHFWPSARGLPWAILMTACGVAMGVGSWIVRRRQGQGKSTAIHRSLTGAWCAFGVSLGIFWIVGGARGLYPDPASFLFVFFVLTGATNFISGAVLRWPLQMAAGALWWATAVITMWAPALVEWIFLAVAVVAEILFGAYMMLLERREARVA